MPVVTPIGQEISVSIPIITIIGVQVRAQYTCLVSCDILVYNTFRGNRGRCCVVALENEDIQNRYVQPECGIHTWHGRHIRHRSGTRMIEHDYCVAFMYRYSFGQPDPYPFPPILIFIGVPLLQKLLVCPIEVTRWRRWQPCPRRYTTIDTYLLLVCVV